MAGQHLVGLRLRAGHLQRAGELALLAAAALLGARGALDPDPQQDCRQQREQGDQRDRPQERAALAHVALLGELVEELAVGAEHPVQELRADGVRLLHARDMGILELGDLPLGAVGPGVRELVLLRELRQLLGLLVARERLGHALREAVLGVAETLECDGGALVDRLLQGGIQREHVDPHGRDGRVLGEVGVGRRALDRGARDPGPDDAGSDDEQQPDAKAPGHALPPRRREERLT